MFGAGRGAAYVALSSGPRDTPQHVLMTPTQRVFVPQLKSLPHTQQIPPPGPYLPPVNLSRGGLSACGRTPHTRHHFWVAVKTQVCGVCPHGLVQSPDRVMCAASLMRYGPGPEKGWVVSWLVWCSDRNRIFIAFTTDSGYEKPFSDPFWIKIQSLFPSGCILRFEGIY